MEKTSENSVEEQIKRIREGYKQELQLNLGGLTVPCRIMTASGKVNAISNAKANLKIPSSHDRKTLESIAVQKAVIKAGCTIDGIIHLNDRLLDQLSCEELLELFDQYEAEVKLCNPKFELLSLNQLQEMVKSVKKKKTSSSDYYTWQLAAVGRFYLDEISRMDKERGSL